jgi:hypothetical protein
MFEFHQSGLRQGYTLRFYPNTLQRTENKDRFPLSRNTPLSTLLTSVFRLNRSVNSYPANAENIVSSQ